MPQYVLFADHSPDICPSSNAKTRARALEGTGEQLPKLAQEAGVRFDVGPLHVDPSHRTFAVLEALERWLAAAGPEARDAALAALAGAVHHVRAADPALAGTWGRYDLEITHHFFRGR